MAKGFHDLSSGVQTAVLALIALAIGAVIFWYYALPKSVEHGNLQEQVMRLRAENDRNEAFKREQPEYLNRIAQLSQQLQTLQSIVPDQPATDAFLSTVYETGIGAGVHIRTFIAEPLVNQELYVEMPFRLHLDGSYYGVLQFFDRLVHLERIVTVSNLTLGPPQGGGMGAYKIAPQETVGANCLVTTYYNRPQETTHAKLPGNTGGK
jgi:type IV pilus assembly protein PilO